MIKISYILCLCFVGAVYASPLDLLGSKECTWGPTHWCKNFQNSRNCHATKHCIQTVWQHLTVPEDNDSVCQICLDMVKQARDQLESNQTQDDLRAVFEGSCKLIYVKPIVKECIKVVDDFIPELIEALASQMNPQVVCSVAGLCNNVKIDQMLTDNEKLNKITLTCENCGDLSGSLISKFHGKSRDDVLENILRLCGEFSSFSDGCSSIVLTHFNELYEHLENNLNGDAICHLTGVCATKFHQHSESIEVRPMSNIGYVKQTSIEDPDIPCELCEQLVNHLRDLLVANTTESEFKQVLEGICRQTKSFKDECLGLVAQYYSEIYQFVVKKMSPNDACFFIGVCPKHVENVKKINIIAPLVPIEVNIPAFYNSKNKYIGHENFESKIEVLQEHNKFLTGLNEPSLSLKQIENAQLPIDKLMGAPNRISLVEGGAWCTMCEYALHFIQEELSDAKNEEEIKKTVMSTCSKMPKSIAPECRNFVELYGDAIIALLIQEVDPAIVCPQLKLCPSNIKKDTEIFAPSTIDVQILSEATKKASCPLCLLAVEQAQQVIQNDKTIDKIKLALEQLCSHLNNKLKMECNDFVETYSKELVDLLMKDFTPQEICVYLKLCSDKRPDLSNYGISMVIQNDNGLELKTNEISDNTIDGIMIGTNIKVQVNNTPECLLCQEIVKQVEKSVVNKNSKAEIIKALENACLKVPKKARVQCEEYIEKHGEKIAELIIQELSPKEICRDIQLCFALDESSETDDLNIDDAIQVTIFANPKKYIQSPNFQEPDLPKGSEVCILCEIVVTKMEKNLEKPATQNEVRAYLDKVCKLLPSSIKNECQGFINTYSMLLIEAFESIPPKKICESIQVCLMSGVKSKGKSNEIVECAICEGSVASLESVIKNKSIDFKIENMLEKSCHDIPARFYERCITMVQTYGISIIEQLKEYPESHNICVDIGMCFRDQSAGFVKMEDIERMSSAEKNAVTDKQFIVGENECTWGPSHWCKNEETATKCNSLDFCKRKNIGMWKA
uniref:CSON002275 protein n=1 Tax=Culicoides sonorensis TaxID=179676 RepID=A0A336LVF0_CULSO